MLPVPAVDPPTPLATLSPESQDPQTRASLVVSLVITTCIVMPVFIICRLYTRVMIKAVFGRDDILILLAAVIAFAISVVAAVSCVYGLGHHFRDVEPTSMKTFYKCHPVRGYWDPPAREWCINMNANLIICVVGVSKIVYLSFILASYDVFYDSAATTAITILEVNLGIVCASLPGAKPIVRSMNCWIAHAGHMVVDSLTGTGKQLTSSKNNTPPKRSPVLRAGTQEPEIGVAKGGAQRHGSGEIDIGESRRIQRLTNEDKIVTGLEVVGSLTHDMDGSENILVTVERPKIGTRPGVVRANSGSQHPDTFG
ncbi:uncharacterized protein BDR25DRAFT_382669 [Lindgomyces ingoldianus]|uniref:Uncharacterized protein n=1 Tax=Lindgomyces ingoldianus TaxID=673940 RepID=A0ACB6R9Z7_9PLEO|nr:uncharacterized protein BDR25DRAFT_382669 [Lindgomyces ingoldianus]KAF2475583.1 hypothetical protein BDR25DRAFT_382669 [Lindgomyces ingoldianus]